MITGPVLFAGFVGASVSVLLVTFVSLIREASGRKQEKATPGAQESEIWE
jgi:hypothetical protein